MRDKREFSYVVDAQDRIVSANGDWFAFAQENGGANLDKKVIGRPLWDFICDAETKILYSLFLKSVRANGLPTHLPYRCDSADERRYMEMTIAPAPEGCVEFSSRMIREEKRDKMALLDTAVLRSKDIIVMCSWCKKVQLKGGDWAEVEAAAKAFDLLTEPRFPKVSHGICSRCKAEMAEYGW
jgi:hypothetical protein